MGGSGNNGLQDYKWTVGRFAPSPTGPLHVGSLVAAVGSYALSRREGGLWLLRMEDLDGPRVRAEYADDILRTLELLGFQWDGEIEWQSRRGEVHQAAFEKLKGIGAVYPCGCTRSELKSSASAPHPGEDGPPYPGTCREGLKPGKEARAWRVRVPEPGIYSFDDMIFGPQTHDLETLCGDFVVLRADGVFAYQLAVVADDADQGVNLVARGADLLTSTPRQILLHQLLGNPFPRYAHFPLATDPGGGKLSKRNNAVSLLEGADLEREGGRLIYEALRFLGQNPPESLAGEKGREVLQWAGKNFDIAAVPTLSRVF